MKKLVFALSVYAAFCLVAGCQKEPMLGLLREDSIVFSINEILTHSEETKATAVTSLSSFNVSAVTGSAGSETAVWTNASFTDAGGSRYAGDKCWPLTNANPYRFYASNATLSFAATGATVTVNTGTDVVCAYLSSPTYKGVNALTFEHIFARIGDVTVSAATGYTITGVSLSITPKTSGTFNLLTGDGETDGTGWSATSNGSAYALANATPGTKSNDLYLIPGAYTLTASWTATKGDYSQTFSDRTYPIDIVSGKINRISATLGGSAEEIKFTVSVTPWGNNSIEEEFSHVAPVDLSLVDPLTGEDIFRETANCYVVTSPGSYCLPLYYGNAIEGGSDNISTAAPAKVNANDGVFVNAYDVAISSGNIKTDLENAGYTLNTSGGKLIWSTASATSNALVIVKPTIAIKDGVGYLCFSVPSDRFQEGSALIGVLKSGSTTEYVWAWHIWITSGNVLSTEDYTNYQSDKIGFLNRPLGGVSSNSLVNVYYQHGMPFPLPPSCGSNTTATLYDENGIYTFNYDSESTITTIGKALSKPYLPRWNNGIYNDASGSAQKFYNMWDATQTGISDKVVVKTIYDPSPAGMCVPRLNAYTGFTTTGEGVSSGVPTNCNVVGSFSNGWKFKKNSSDATGSPWAASGYRGSGSVPSGVGSNGNFWSACLRMSANGYFLKFDASSVYTKEMYNRHYGYSVRPAIKKGQVPEGRVDLSKVNPLTGASMIRETANCYVVTAPGDYCLPLFYGNAVVNGTDNISTAAPAKVNANDGVFVNAYDVAISSGNIKTDLENAGQTLNTSGGKLIWSTASATSNALVTVDSQIEIINGVGYLCFSVPSDRFQEGSALIGVLKSGSTTEYVWAWYIWITNSRVLATEEYTNYQSDRIDFLNRPLGGRGGTSLISTYYQYGMPFPLPPSSGSNANATLYDENGSYTFNYDSGNTITTLGKALSKPYLPRWNNGIYNDASGSAQNFYNIWDATQTGTSDKVVVKTIYDPSPAGMSVPRLNAYTGFTTTGQNVTSDAPTNCNVVGSFSNGWKIKKNSSDATGSLWAVFGSRYSGSAPALVGSNGYYWSACPGVLNQLTVGYYLRFNSSYVSPLYSGNRYFGLSVQPALLQI